MSYKELFDDILKERGEFPEASGGSAEELAHQEAQEEWESILPKVVKKAKGVTLIEAQRKDIEGYMVRFITNKLAQPTIGSGASAEAESAKPDPPEEAWKDRSKVASTARDERARAAARLMEEKAKEATQFRSSMAQGMQNRSKLDAQKLEPGHDERWRTNGRWSHCFRPSVLRSDGAE